jgi:hypothetical protein
MYRDSEIMDWEIDEKDLVDPASWSKLIAWLKTLPVMEECDGEDPEPFI